MTKDIYVICSETENFQVTRSEAEAFLVNRIGFNAPAANHALNGVRDCGDHINLREGYVIRRPLSMVRNVECGDCHQLIFSNQNHTCFPQIAANRRHAR